MPASPDPGFKIAAGAFLSRFGIGPHIPPDLPSLRKIYRAFGQLPYENVSKITRHYQEGTGSGCSLRSPAEVIEGFLAERLGGTCFSLTQTLWTLLGFCGFDCYRVLGDMHHGPNIHCAVMVGLSGEKLLCDAGYLVPEPLQAVPAGSSTLKGPLYTYLLREDSRSQGLYHLHTRSPGASPKWRYSIRDRGVDDRVFEHHWKLSFDLPMNRHLLLSRSHEQGQIYIHKHKLRLTTVRGHTNSNIRPDLARRVEEMFGIDHERVAYALSLIEQSQTGSQGKTR